MDRVGRGKTDLREKEEGRGKGEGKRQRKKALRKSILVAKVRKRAR